MKNQEDELDQLVRGHVNAEIGPHAGRAAAAFRRSVGKASGVQKRRWLLAAGVVFAAAAMVVIAAIPLGIFETSDRGPAPEGAVVQAKAASIPIYDNVTLTRQVDGGPAIVDNTPVRIVREQNVNRVQWIDAEDQSVITVTRPVERIGYVVLNPY